MKILVTGGAGFIGSNVVDAYINAGHEALIADNLSSGKLENINPKAKFYKIDIRSEEIRRLITSEKPDVINHHAAQISTPASVGDPIFDAGVNIIGLLHILEAARIAGVKKVIFVSSGGTIYGDADELPTPETCPARPVSPYAIGKYTGENYLRFYSKQYGLDYTVLRYANIYGPRQVPYAEAGVAAIFMDRLISKKPCQLNHYPEEPRGMVRDYCYIGDVTRANLLALTNGKNEVLNIGTGIGTYTIDLFNAIFESLKRNFPELPDELKMPQMMPARPGDMKMGCIDSRKAEKALGWRPEVDLKTGIELTVKWRLAVNSKKAAKGEN